MVSNSPGACKPNGLGKTPDEIKAHFVRNGTSLNQFAKRMKVSHPLVSKLIHGQRPGRTGRSKRVMAELRKELASIGGAR